MTILWTSICLPAPVCPPPPPMDRDAFWEYQARRLAEFYQSPHYEAWFKRTSEEMRKAKPFVWID
jgi:hypothetical protein